MEKKTVQEIIQNRFFSMVLGTNGSLLCLLSKIYKNLPISLTLLSVMVKSRNVNEAVTL